jgi:hypothetical protein
MTYIESGVFVMCILSLLGVGRLTWNTSIKKIDHVQCMCVNEVSELCMDRHIFYFYRASIRF